MSRRAILRELPEKIIYKISDGAFCSFRDDYFCSETGHRFIVPGKGSVNHRIAAYFMEKLHLLGISNYFVKSINMREHAIGFVENFPFSVRVWNRTNSFFCQKFGLSEHQTFEKPIVEYVFLDQNYKKVLLTQEHLMAFDWICGEELDDLENFALKINDLLRGLCVGFDLQVGSLYLDIGRGGLTSTEQFVLSSEIIPDYVDFFDVREEINLDKSMWVNMDPSEIAEIYQGVAHRFNMNLGEQLSAVLSLEDYKGPVRHSC